MGKLRQVIRKVDDNQSEIVKAFRELGYSVVSTAKLGNGFPDIICGKFGHNYLFEIKNSKNPPSKRRLTEDEERFFTEWNGSVMVITSVDEVINFDLKRRAV